MGEKKIDFSKKWWAEGLDFESRFDRIRYQFGIADPAKSFVGNGTIKEWNEEILGLEKEAKASSGGVITVSKERFDELVYRKKHLCSCIHPDSGSLIPWFARTNAFVTTNIPIISAMMLSPPTMFNTNFWQWFNQTYNAVFNFSNRNASSSVTNAQILQSYGIAVISAIGSAMALRKVCGMLFGSALTGTALALSNSVTNYGAICISSGSNVFFMRSPEIAQGIDVLDPETMQPVGVSKVAAKMGVMQSIYSRFIYCLPIFFTSPILESLFGAVGLMPKQGPLRSIMSLGFIGTGLWIAMPVCAGFYRNYERIAREDLEEDIRANLKEGQQYLLYNKGV